jgi:hypothetical protein
MKVRYFFWMLLAVFLLVGCHRDPVKPPPEDRLLEGGICVWVGDSEGQPLDSVSVQYKWLQTPWCWTEITNPAGFTSQYHFDLVPSKAAFEVTAKKPGYVPVVDTFGLAGQERQIQEVILPYDSRIIWANLLFAVQDTAGNPINEAGLFFHWYPGAGWKSQFQKTIYTDAAGKAHLYAFPVDSLRNCLFVEIDKTGFKSVTDSIIITIDSIYEVNYKLGPE